MSEENGEFTEKFETIEQALKYVSDSQAKAEWVHKKDKAEWNQKIEEMRQLQEKTQKQLDYLTKLTGIAFEDIMFQDEKINEAGEVLTKKNPKRV